MVLPSRQGSTRSVLDFFAQMLSLTAFRLIPPVPPNLVSQSFHLKTSQPSLATLDQDWAYLHPEPAEGHRAPCWDHLEKQLQDLS